MPNFEENNLSQEELTSGISQDHGEDETFALESMDEYPGNLPDSLKDQNLPEEQDWTKADKQVKIEELNEPATEKPESVEEPLHYEKSGVLENEDTEIYGSVHEAEIIEPPQSGTVWDMFDKEDEEQAAKISQENHTEAHPEYDDSAKYQAEDIDELKQTTLIEEPTLKPADDLVEKISTLSESELEPVKIDEDLKNLLLSDIEKNKEKTKVPEKQESEGQENIQTDDKKEFIELSETEDAEAQVIDIGSIVADKPSNYGLDSSVMEEIAEEELSEGMHIALPKRKPAVKPDETGQIKERKKLNIPFMYIGIAAGIILILSAATLGVYKLFIEKPEQKVIAVDSLKTKLTPKKSLANLEITKSDTTKIDKAKEILPPTEKKSDSVQKNIPRKIILADKQIKPELPKENKHYQFIEKEKKQPEKKPEITKPAKTEPVKLADKVPEKKKEVAQTVTLPEPEKKLFVVQVYSTPNKSDAEEWLARLANKNIQNAFISEQKIRDKIWYRVRFGNFKTRDEAMQEALKFGFAQTWIDRIK